MSEKNTAAPETVDLLEASDAEFVAAFDKRYARYAYRLLREHGVV